MADASCSISDRMRFRFHKAAICQRRYPFQTGHQRQLPFTLLQQIRDGEYRFQHADRIDRIIHPDEAFLVPVGVRHQLGISKPGGTATSLWMYFTSTSFEGIDLYAFLDEPIFFNCEVGRELGRIIVAIEQAQTGISDSLRQSARIQELGYRLNGLLLQTLPQISEQFSQGDFIRLSPALAYIRAHYNDPLDRNRLANQVHLSPTRFHYVFKKLTGMAPMEYVREMRLNRARELLIQTDMKVYEIAALSGFADPYYFSRVFHRTQGQTPLAYRRQAAAAISS